MQVRLKAFRRKNEKNRTLRQKGMVPGVLFAKDLEAIKIYVKERELNACMKHGEVLNIDLDEIDEYIVHIDEIQSDPVTHQKVHVTMKKLTQGMETTVALPIMFTGEDALAKSKTALTFIHNHVNVTGLPKNLPEFVVVDVSDMSKGEKIQINDLVAPEGVRYSSCSGDQTIVVCSATPSLGASLSKETEVEPVVPEIIEEAFGV